MSTSTLVTAEQLLEMPPNGMRTELINGELLEMSPSSLDHVLIAGRLLAQLGPFVLQNKLGEVGACGGGFVVQRNPDTVLAPDVIFVSHARLAAIRGPGAFATGAPDLVAEIQSPGERAKDVDQKAVTWLSAGANLVWVINPRKRTATIYRPGLPPEIIDENSDLTGEDILPGFRLRLGEVLV